MSVNYSKDSNAEYLRLVMQVLQNRYVSGITTFVGEGPKFIQWHRKNGMSGGGGRFVFSVHEMVGNIREIIKYSYTINFVYGIKGSSYLKSLESSACTITDDYEMPQNDIGFRVVMEQL